MKRQELNALVLSQLGEVLQDSSTVSELIGKAYTGWFQNLAKQGTELLAPAPAAPAAPAGDATGAPPGGGGEMLAPAAA